MDLSRDGFTNNEIKNALHSSNRQIGFRYELLDNNNRKIRDLTNITSGKIEHGMLNEIKRTATFSLVEDGNDIDYLNNRIKPYMQVYVRGEKSYMSKERVAFIQAQYPTKFKEMEITENKGWVDFPLGVFLLSSPTRKDESTSVNRDIEAYDLTLILKEDKFIDRYEIAKGTNYYDAIVEVLVGAGIDDYNLEQTDSVTNRILEFSPGDEKIKAVNSLLSQLNYTPIYVDENGYFTSRKYKSPARRRVEYEYLDNEQSVTLVGAEEELDTFDIANVFTMVRTNEEEPPLVSTFVNDDTDSMTSIVNRGRRIVDYREVDDIANQEALDDRVERIAFEANQVYGHIRFESALMPLHSYGNLLRFKYSPLDIDNDYLELNWSMNLEVGGKMNHELRQVVDIKNSEVNA